MKGFRKYGWLLVLSLGFVFTPDTQMPWGIWDFSWEAGFCVGAYLGLTWKI